MDRAAKLVGIAALFTTFLWVVSTAPLIGGALAIVIASAWSAFLERRDGPFSES